MYFITFLIELALVLLINNRLQVSGMTKSIKSRKTVPAALHAELTEYAYLLRALRTRDTLDLASRLIRRPFEDEDADLYADDPGPEDVEHSTTPLPRRPSAGPSTTTSPQGKDPANNDNDISKKGGRKRKAKDLWTRWPLLAGDVHIPEWTLEDEVRSLAIQFFKLRGHSPSSGDPADEFEDEEARLPPLALKNLTLVSSAFLSHILALIAAHIPPADKSMQNRFKPLNWENVLAISATSELVSTEYVFLSFFFWSAYSISS
jgi:hypothetical protein